MGEKLFQQRSQKQMVSRVHQLTLSPVSPFGPGCPGMPKPGPPYRPPMEIAFSKDQQPTQGQLYVIHFVSDMA